MRFGKKADSNFYFLMVTVFFLLSIIYAFTILVGNSNDISAITLSDNALNAKSLDDRLNSKIMTKQHEIEANAQHIIYDYYEKKRYEDECKVDDYPIIGSYCNGFSNLENNFKNRLSRFGSINSNEKSNSITYDLDKTSIVGSSASVGFRSFIEDPKHNIESRMKYKMSTYQKNKETIGRYLELVRVELEKNPIDGFDEFDVLGLISQESDFRANIYRCEPSILDNYERGTYSKLINNCDSCEKKISEFNLNLIQSGGLKNCPAIAASGGLTQVLLPTARGYDSTFEFEDFFIPSRSIEIGIKALSGMKRSTGVDKISTLVAYNGGPTRIRNLKEKFEGVFEISNYYEMYIDEFKLERPLTYAVQVQLQANILRDLFGTGLKEYDEYLDELMQSTGSQKISSMDKGDITLYYDNIREYEIKTSPNNYKIKTNGTCPASYEKEQLEECIDFDFEMAPKQMNYIYSDADKCYFEASIDEGSLHIVTEHLPNYHEPNYYLEFESIQTPANGIEYYYKDGDELIALNDNYDLNDCYSHANYILADIEFPSLTYYDYAPKLKAYYDLGFDSEDYGNFFVNYYPLNGSNEYVVLEFLTDIVEPYNIYINDKKIKFSDYDLIKFEDLEFEDVPFFMQDGIIFNSSDFAYIQYDNLTYNVADYKYYYITRKSDEIKIDFETVSGKRKEFQTILTADTKPLRSIVKGANYIGNNKFEILLPESNWADGTSNNQLDGLSYIQLPVASTYTIPDLFENSDFYNLLNKQNKNYNDKKIIAQKTGIGTYEVTVPNYDKNQGIAFFVNDNPYAYLLNIIEE